MGYGRTCVMRPSVQHRISPQSTNTMSHKFPATTSTSMFTVTSLSLYSPVLNYICFSFSLWGTCCSFGSLTLLSLYNCNPWFFWYWTLFGFFNWVSASLLCTCLFCLFLSQVLPEISSAPIFACSGIFDPFLSVPIFLDSPQLNTLHLHPTSRAGC